MSSEQFSVGSLVRVREREWVVLPSETPDVLNLKPLSGAEAESCGIFLPLERDEVQPAQFQPPKLLMNIYTEAVTPAKREAASKVVDILWRM
jgi:hypothetical protein